MGNAFERKVMGAETRKSRFYRMGDSLPEIFEAAILSCGHDVRIPESTNHPEMMACPKCKKNAAARARRAAYANLGMKRVRGNLGGVYYE
jgi:hypothetical protein